MLHEPLFAANLIRPSFHFAWLDSSTSVRKVQPQHLAVAHILNSGLYVLRTIGKYYADSQLDRLPSPTQPNQTQAPNIREEKAKLNDINGWHWIADRETNR